MHIRKPLGFDDLLENGVISPLMYEQVIMATASFFTPLIYGDKAKLRFGLFPETL